MELSSRTLVRNTWVMSGVLALAIGVIVGTAGLIALALGY